ncbi:MAG: hypothetical protein ABSB41_09450 [Anaerolineales bacterium]|jgi:hypothetical protein
MPEINQLITLLGSLAKDEADRVAVANLITALDDRYDLSAKIARERGVEEILKQLIGRLESAFGSLTGLKGKRVLDIACGSNTSRAPSFVYIDTPFGETRIPVPHTQGYTAQFEPWFCRILLELGADPVGIDIGDLEAESFEHYAVDLGLPSGLDFLPSHSFDALQDSRLFGSPEFTARFPDRDSRLKVARALRDQEKRLLKADGVIVHSDAKALRG